MSHHLLRRSATSILALVAGLVPFAADPTARTTDTSGTPSVEFHRLPAAAEAMAVWAIDLFEHADMELPSVRFVHHGDDRQPCRGRIGFHRPELEGSVIDICTDDVSFPTQVMILHELAHAWVDHNVGEETRRAFRALRSYEHWRDYEQAAWHENGTEQAAEIIVWGLIDRPMAMVRIHQNSCDELEEGYRLLTSSPPLHGFRDKCG